MDTTEYRAKAAEVLREAGQIRDGSLRRALLDLSACYLRLAELAEKKTAPDAVLHEAPLRRRA